MKKCIVFALVMALTGAIHATPPSKSASTSGKTLSNTATTTQAGSSTAAPAQTSTGSAAQTSGSNTKWVCPPGVKPESGNTSECYPRPTRQEQK